MKSDGKAVVRGTLIPCMIKSNPNDCQYTLINFFEWYLLFQMAWISTGPPKVSDLPTALVKNVTFTNFCLDSLHSATASFWSSINLQKSLFHLINWSINTLKAKVSEENTQYPSLLIAWKVFSGWNYMSLKIKVIAENISCIKWQSYLNKLM